VLLVIGLFHMLLVWNGDILTLYAVCGLLLIPFVAMSRKLLATLGLTLIVLAPFLPFFDSLFPTIAEMSVQAAVATCVYTTGSFTEILALRWHETAHFIAPLLMNSMPRTFGLMLFWIAAWGSGILQRQAEKRIMLKAVLILAGSLGALATTLQIWSKETGQLKPDAFDQLYPHSVVLLAFAYGAAMLLWLTSAQTGQVEWLTRLFAAAGRMAFSNYLAQSVIFSLLFHGFGGGLFGRLGNCGVARPNGFCRATRRE